MLYYWHQFLLFSVIFVSSVGVIRDVVGYSNCDPVEGYYLSHGEDYRGRVNVTEGGVPCQKWSDPRVHGNDIFVPNPLTGVGDHNYCRNPNGLERPGCFTINPFIRYQLCSVGYPCKWTPLKPVVQFEPNSGTQLLNGQSVTITCYPRPCRIYYTLNGTAPTAAIETLYSRPIILTNATTVKALALFVSKETLQRQAVYSIQDSLPLTTAYFSPLFSGTSYGPVLVVLKGLKKNDTVLIYRNLDLRGKPYEGPFWLNQSTNLTAVINEKSTVQARYTIVASGAPVVMYPSSGKYIGGVSCLVYQSDSQSNYAISVNHSEWQPLNKLTFVVDTFGRNIVGVRATQLGGVMSFEWRTYEILEAVLPLLSPSPDIVYRKPIRVTCSDPLGRALVVNMGAGEKSLFSRRLDTPGRFSVDCTYVDNLHQLKTIHAVYELRPLLLPMPLLRPECGRRFPMTQLILLATIVPPPDRNEVDGFSRLRLNITASGATLRPLLGAHSFVLTPTHPAPLNVTLTLTTHFFDPLEAHSLPFVCHYEILPLASFSTPWFVGRHTCDDADICVNALVHQVSTCLSFQTDELIHSVMVGPFLMIRLVRLPLSLQNEYYARTSECLLNISLIDIRNETSGLIQLARRWAVKAVSPSSDFTTGVEVEILVEGWGLESGEFRFVRHEYTCDDIGLRFSEKDLLTSFSLQLSFIFDTPGVYKLCAEISNALYEVPSLGPLKVVPSPLPMLYPTPCGGRSEGSIDVVANVRPHHVHKHVFLSVDVGEWRRLTAGAVIHVARLTRTSGLASTTLAFSTGKQGSNSAVCVFYASHCETPKRVTYRWSVISFYEDTRSVLLAVNGTFCSDSRVEFWVYKLGKIKAKSFYLEKNITMLQAVLKIRPSFTSLGTVTDALAVADRPLPLVGNTDETPLFVVAFIDGVFVQAEPLAIALSPLAVAMHSCRNCTSGWCFHNRCVFVGKSNHTAHLCVEPSLPPIPIISGTSRFLFLLLFLIGLAVVAFCVRVAIVRGTARNAGGREERDVIVEP